MNTPEQIVAQVIKFIPEDMIASLYTMIEELQYDAFNDGYLDGFNAKESKDGNR